MAKRGQAADGPETHAVRVRVREVPYLTWETDRAGGDVLVERSGFGPGMPQLDPTNKVMSGEIEADSDEHKEALDAFAQGQVIELLDHDYYRLLDAGAVIDVGDEPEILNDEGDAILDPSTATVEDLRNWIETDHPTVNDVVQASGGDPEIASKLLEAESQAHGGEPRKGVLDGLGTVIGRG